MRRGQKKDKKILKKQISKMNAAKKQVPLSSKKFNSSLLKQEDALNPIYNNLFDLEKNVNFFSFAIKEIEDVIVQK